MCPGFGWAKLNPACTMLPFGRCRPSVPSAGRRLSVHSSMGGIHESWPCCGVWRRSFDHNRSKLPGPRTRQGPGRGGPDAFPVLRGHRSQSQRSDSEAGRPIQARLGTEIRKTNLAVQPDPLEKWCPVSRQTNASCLLCRSRTCTSDGRSRRRKPIRQVDTHFGRRRQDAMRALSKDGRKESCSEGPSASATLSPV